MLFPTLKTIASTDIISVDIHQTVHNALSEMHRRNHRMVLVKNREIFYIFTTNDLVHLKLKNTSFDTPLSDLTLGIIPTFPEHENILAVLRATHGKTHEYIGLTNDNGELCGLVTNSDIIGSVDPQIMMDTMTIGSLFNDKYCYGTAHPTDNVYNAIHKMDQLKVDSIVVFDSANYPIGIITAKDILKIMNTPHSESLTVNDFMSSPIDTLPCTTTVGDAVAFSQDKHYKRIIVTKENGQILGIITQKELIAQTYLRWSKLVKEHFMELEEISTLLKERNRQLANLAAHDQLTGLLNRHFFIELFEKELSYARRYNGSLSLILLDIDHFKHINDTFGHNIGDDVLRLVSQLCKNNLRTSDIFARWGGEEFVILLPNTPYTNAFDTAEKLRALIETTSFPIAEHVTCCFGVAEIFDSESLNEIIERADKALYQAKNDGRNCTRGYVSLNPLSS